MYNFLQSICLIFLFIIMFLFPSETFQGAAKGLLLWYNSVFPTLFPYMIISTLMIQTNTTSFIAKIFGPVLERVFHVSSNGVFAIVSGMLCGYPMGAKITAELIDSEKITPEEGAYLISFCNNISPMFMLNFVLMNGMNNTELIIPGMCIYLLSPVLCSYLFYSFFYKQKTYSQLKNTLFFHTSTSDFFHCLDISIMKSIHSIVQVGGYIILFSILITLLDVLIHTNTIYKYLLISFFEITNGIIVLSKISIPSEIQWILTLFISSFGGLCSVAQTSCVTKQTTISIKTYIIEKLITATVTSLLAILYLTMQRIV